MRIALQICLLLLGFALLPLHSFGQETTASDSVSQNRTKQEVRIETKDGSTFVGTVIQETDSFVEIETTNGIFKIKRSEIEELKYINSSRGSGWFTNPSKTRLLLNQSARMPTAGDGYYQNIYIFFSRFNVGVTDFFSIGAGFSMLPGAGLSNQLFTFNAKLGTSLSDRLSVAANYSVFLVPSSAEERLNTFSGIGTYEWDNGSLTGGLSVGRVLGDGAIGVVLGGDFRISKRLALVSDNLFFPEADFNILSYGVRFIGKSISADLAFLQPTADGEFAEIGAGIPFVDFVFHF